MTRDFFLTEAAKALASHPRKSELLEELSLWLGADEKPPVGEAKLSPRYVFSEVSRAIIEADAANAVPVLGGLASRVRPWIVLAETIAWCGRTTADALAALDPSVLDTKEADAHVSRVVEERARLLGSAVPQPRFDRGTIVIHDPDKTTDAPPTDTWLEWTSGQGMRVLLAWVPTGFPTNAIPLEKAFDYVGILPTWAPIVVRR